jgi:hypothetical protein
VIPEVSDSAETSIAEGGAIVELVECYRVCQKPVGSLTCTICLYIYACVLFVEVKVRAQVKAVEMYADLLLRFLCGWNDGEVPLSVYQSRPIM